MKAGDLASSRPQWDLVGRKIALPPVGNWPGVEATITEVFPNIYDPETVFTVHSRSLGEFWLNADDEIEFAEL